eukprot:349784-Chlamydomonas_euryale.AAC.1
MTSPTFLPQRTFAAHHVCISHDELRMERQHDGSLATPRPPRHAHLPRTMSASRMKRSEWNADMTRLACATIAATRAAASAALMPSSSTRRST